MIGAYSEGLGSIYRTTVSWNVGFRNLEDLFEELVALWVMKMKLRLV